MIEQIPWAYLLCGVAAALAILVIYDVCYVWPLCRRLAATNERCRVLEERLDFALTGTDRLAALEKSSRERWSQLGERLGQLELISDTRAYDDAIDSAERGAEPERLIERFGLSEGEAELVRLIHGDAGVDSTDKRRRKSRRRAA
jgi:Protein of unknown function (DUF2802)